MAYFVDEEIRFLEELHGVPLDVLVRIQRGNVIQAKVTEIVHENDRKKFR